MVNREGRKRAVIYTRVSRDDTGEGKSNQRQEEDCRKLADLRGWDVVAVESDISISASSGKARPAWQRVLGMVERGEVELVLAWHLDRLTRTMLDLEELILLAEKHRVGVATVTGDIDLTTDTGQMVARIFAAVARQEVQRKAARQKRANQQRRAEGTPWKSGWRAFGYTLDGEVIPEEAALIRKAATDVLGGESLREIARRWRALGVTTPRSSKGADGWTHNGVRKILLNPRNAGLITYRGEIVGKGAWEPVLSEEDHTLLVAKLTDPARLTNGGKFGRQAANLLSGIATCAVCKEPVAGGTVSRRATPERVPVYKCKNNHLSTVRADADSIVVSAFAATVAITRPGLLMPIHRKGADANALQAEAQSIRDNLNALSGSFAAGRITLEQLETASASLRERLASIERELADGDAGKLDVRVLRADNVRRFLQHNVEQQRAILARLADIRLYPKGRGKKNVPITQQVTVHLRTVRADGSENLIPALAERPADDQQLTAGPSTRPQAPVTVAAEHARNSAGGSA